MELPWLLVSLEAWMQARLRQWWELQLWLGFEWRG